MASELRVRALWIAFGWGLILLIVYLSLTPAPVELPLQQGDKLSHGLAYLVLMSWFANLYETRAQRLRYALGFICLASALEFLQRWTGYRSFDFFDVVAGSAGVAAGWTLAPPRTPNFLGTIEAFLGTKAC